MTRPISDISLRFFVNSPYTTDGTFSEKSQKMSKNLPKTGSSKHPWLTANPITWTSFFGNLKNPTIFKFQNMPAPEHVSTPLVSSLKITFFPKNERTKKNGNLVLTVRTDVKSASRNNSVFFHKNVEHILAAHSARNCFCAKRPLRPCAQSKLDFRSSFVRNEKT